VCVCLCAYVCVSVRVRVCVCSVSLCSSFISVKIHFYSHDFRSVKSFPCVSSLSGGPVFPDRLQL